MFLLHFLNTHEGIFKVPVYNNKNFIEAIGFIIIKSIVTKEKNINFAIWDYKLYNILDNLLITFTTWGESELKLKIPYYLNGFKQNTMCIINNGVNTWNKPLEIEKGYENIRKITITI